jgi:hypothetical protein
VTPLQPPLLLFNPCLLIGWLVFRQKVIFISAEGPTQDGTPYLTHQAAHEVQIVNGSQAIGQELITVK